MCKIVNVFLNKAPCFETGQKLTRTNHVHLDVWTRGCLDPKMMNCYFSSFCRKKVPDLIKKVLHNFGWPLGSKPLKSYKDIYLFDNLVRNALLFNIYCQKADFCCCWLSRAPIRVTPRPKLRLSRLFALNPNLYT